MITDGRSRRAIAIIMAASDVPHPASPTSAAYPCARTMASMESAIKSRLISDKVPPTPLSEPPMVVNSRGVPPESRTPRLTACAWRANAILPGDASFQLVTTPTNGRAICADVSPMACRRARCGAAATLSGERLVWFGVLPVRDGPEARVPLAPASSSIAVGVGWCEASAAGCARLADPQ